MLTDDEVRVLLVEADIWWKENTDRIRKPSSMDTTGHCSFTTEPEFADDREALIRFHEACETAANRRIPCPKCGSFRHNPDCGAYFIIDRAHHVSVPPGIKSVCEVMGLEPILADC